MAGVNVTFPGNLAQVQTAQDLRSIPSSLIASGDLYLVNGLQGLFEYDPGSVSVDDGTDVIRPYDKTPLQAGRWIRNVDGLASGPIGPAGGDANSYATLAGMKAAGVTGLTYNLAAPTGSDGGVANGLFTYQLGNFTGRTDVVQLNGVPLATGALVRQAAASVNFDGRSTDAKLRETVSLTDARFAGGAKGDGVSYDDDVIAALLAGVSPGSEVLIPPKTYRLKKSIILDYPIVFRGGAKENVVFNFDAVGDYVALGASGEKACIFVRHTATSGAPDDARRSVLSGFTVQGNSAPNTHGIVFAAPGTLDEIDSKGHGLDGIFIVADAFGASSAPIAGNANGCVVYNAIAQGNGRHGFHFLGDNANACTLLSCKAPANGAWGFYDDSLLGNTFVGCEADANVSGGYYANPAKPIRSVFLGCYSETPGHFSLGPLSGNLFSQGLYKPTRASGGVGLHGLPNGNAYITNIGVNFAFTDDIAEADGSGSQQFAHYGADGIRLKAQAGGRLVALNGLLSVNYTTWFNGGVPVFSFPNSAFAGNISPDRVHYQGGWTIGGAGKSGVVGAGSAPPASGDYTQGAIWLNDSPAAGGKIGWVCVIGGSPGTWKPWGLIDA